MPKADPLDKIGILALCQKLLFGIKKL